MMINGTPENNNLAGTANDDTIKGLGGDDLIDGGLGDDSIEGGNGDDIITFGAGAKIVNGGRGNDTIQLDFSAQTEDFNLTYNKFEGLSPTTGGILDGTTIEAIEQFDVTSGSGDDFIDIATASLGSVVAGGAGDDSLIGGVGDDSLLGGLDNDTFFGGTGNDEITGGDGNDAAVFLGLGSDYEVVIGETAISVTGGPSRAIVSDEPDAVPEAIPVVSFTDTLSSDVEIILFDNGEIDTETGEFKPFETDSPPADAPSIEIGTDADLVIPEPAEPDAEEEVESPEGETSEEDTDESGSTDADTDTEDDGITVYEFFRTDTQTQFYTTDEKERDVILEELPQFELEGVSFVGAAPPAEGEDITGIIPVYRFFNTLTGVHLYTVDEREKTFVEENLDNFEFEGTPYYGFDAQEEGTIPLYRFYNESLGAHFYTTSDEERSSFIESPDFEAEGGDGIAYYVEPPSEV